MCILVRHWPLSAPRLSQKVDKCFVSLFHVGTDLASKAVRQHSHDAGTAALQRVPHTSLTSTQHDEVTIAPSQSSHSRPLHSFSFIFPRRHAELSSLNTSHILPFSNTLQPQVNIMPSATGSNWEKYKQEFADDEKPEKKITPLTDECVVRTRIPTPNH